MKITDAFLGEHGVFYAEFDHIEEMLASEPGLEIVQETAALLASALKPHAEMEDELLFGPALERLDHPHDALMLMHDEHEEVERHITAVRNATNVTTAGEMLGRAVELARDHFRKEESVTFPLAEQLLGEEELLRRGTAWAERRTVHLEAPDLPAMVTHSTP
jgi:iron-sulfur cluster repair protein YtfE (RIC family)